MRRTFFFFSLILVSCQRVLLDVYFSSNFFVATLSLSFTLIDCYSCKPNLFCVGNAKRNVKKKKKLYRISN